jgi:hypothetical protein
MCFLKFYFSAFLPPIDQSTVRIKMSAFRSKIVLFNNDKDFDFVLDLADKIPSLFFCVFRFRVSREAVRVCRSADCNRAYH